MCGAEMCPLERLGPEGESGKVVKEALQLAVASAPASPCFLSETSAVPCHALRQLVEAGLL